MLHFDLHQGNKKRVKDSTRDMSQKRKSEFKLGLDNPSKQYSEFVNLPYFFNSIDFANVFCPQYIEP